LENPALGSWLLAIVDTPSSVRMSSNTKKKNNVMAVPNRNFFFQLRLDLEEDFRFGMCREVWCLIRRDLHGGAIFDEPVLFTAQDLF
jgi:hypothetical protein